LIKSQQARQARLFYINYAAVSLTWPKSKLLLYEFV
jgi:hypothetical protein